MTSRLGLRGRLDGTGAVNGADEGPAQWYVLSISSGTLGPRGAQEEELGPGIV
jgi:hypothetical protein